MPKASKPGYFAVARGKKTGIFLEWSVLHCSSGGFTYRSVVHAQGRVRAPGYRRSRG
jgi:hypothetical protein